MMPNPEKTSDIKDCYDDLSDVPIMRKYIKQKIRNKVIYKIFNVAAYICGVAFFASIYYGIITYDKIDLPWKVFVLSPVTILVIALLAKVIIPEEME